MINSSKTKSKFGYDPETLTSGSNKKIITNCDYCGEEIEVSNKVRNNCNKIVNKDACNKCRYIKREEVSLARDGVKNSAQREDVRKKISESSSERLKSEEYKTEFKKIMIEKYGAESALAVPEIRDKQRQTIKERYGDDVLMRLPKYRDRIVKKSIQTRIDNGHIETFNGKTRPEIAKERGFSRSHFGKLVNKYGIDFAIQHEKGRTYIEALVREEIKSYGLDFVEQFKVNRKIADFKIGNLIIECDGLRWHSDLFVDDNYHVDKMNLYKKHGFRSLFLREDEIRDKFPIVRSVIKNALGLIQNKIGARKLSVEKVPYPESKIFINENHLMGSTTAVSHSFGLYHENNLLSLLQMRKKKDGYEVARFCNKLEYSIPGSFSRLLKHFIREVDCSKIFTFIDKRYGEGTYLPSLGFRKTSEHKSFSWTDFTNTYHRMKFSGNSGYDFGLHKLWDCGQARYELNL